MNRTLESVARAQSVTVIFTRRVAEILPKIFLTGKRGVHCEGEILDFACGFLPEGPPCPSGYSCGLFLETGAYVCCPEDYAWRRRRRRNENEKDNGKTGKIYVRAKWPITPGFVSGFSIA